MNDVLYLSEIKNSLNNKLLNQKRLKLFKSINEIYGNKS